MAIIDERSILASRLWRDLEKAGAEDAISPEAFARHVLFIVFLAHRQMYSFSRNMDEDNGSFSSLLTSLNENFQGLPTQRNIYSKLLFKWLNKLCRNDVRESERDRRLDQDLQEKTLYKVVRIIDSFYQYKLSEKDSRYLFDYLFQRYIVDQRELGRQRAEYTTALAAALVNNRLRHVTDLFTQNGELFIAINSDSSDKNSKGRHPDFHALAFPRIYDFEFALRMEMHGIDFSLIQNEELQRDQPKKRKFISGLVLCEPLNAWSKENIFANEDRESFYRLSAIDFINLGVLESNFDIVVVVVPYADAGAKGYRQQVREQLIQSGKLLAVIDLPFQKNRSRSRNDTIWIITGNETYREERGVLFISANAIHSDELNENSIEANVLIDIVRAAFKHPLLEKSDIKHEPSSQERRYTAILGKRFSKGYEDIPGLCQFVKRNEILRNNAKLRSTDYVILQKQSDWLSRLDDSEVLNYLRGRNRRNNRIYIIGNNGEGKSLLLRELAKRFSDEGRKTLALSFGPSDRFQYVAKPNNHNYVYLGARTAETGISASKIAVAMGEQMCSIHDEQIRLEVFNQVISDLGFLADYYLLPADSKTTFIAGEESLAQVIKLTDPTPEDTHYLEKYRSDAALRRRYKLGLRRDGEHIVPFDDLSSGEQQVLQLSIKITANAEREALVILDEPETSLHVSWQQTLPGILATFSYYFEMDIVVATHSPLIISNATQDDDVCFAAKDGVLSLIPQSAKRSVETVVFEGFDVHTENNREVHEQCAEIVASCIEAVNQTVVNSEILDNARTKLQQMKWKVQKVTKLESINVGRDLELIEQAVRAVDEIDGMQNTSSRNDIQDENM